MRGRLAAVLLVLGVAPATASAHGVIRIGGGELVCLSDDSISASRLEIAADLVSIRVYDPGSVGRIQAPSSCRPQRVDGRGYTIEYACPASGVLSLRAETGPNEDRAVVTGPMPARLYGNSGADGERDEIACGAGADRVAADQLDAVGADCETVERAFVEPPPTRADGDETAPLVALRAPGSRRVGSGRIAVQVRSLEAGEAVASAFLAVSGVNLRVPSVRRRVQPDCGRS